MHDRAAPGSQKYIKISSTLFLFQCPKIFLMDLSRVYFPHLTIDLEIILLGMPVELIILHETRIHSSLSQKVRCTPANVSTCMIQVSHFQQHCIIKDTRRREADSSVLPTTVNKVCWKNSKYTPYGPLAELGNTGACSGAGMKG